MQDSLLLRSRCGGPSRSELLAFNPRPRVERTGFELQNTRLGPHSPTTPRH